MKKDDKKTEKDDPKDLRYRKKYFPNAESIVFSTSQKGFIPLPIVFRKVMKGITAPEFRVLIYLCLRASRFFICYPTYEEIIHAWD
jgi:hypothetical protein